MSGQHQLVGDTLTREEGGIVARCVCGWTSGPRFSMLAASAAMLEHQERAAPAGKVPNAYTTYQARGNREDLA